MLMGVTKKSIVQFQVGYMSFSIMKLHKTFREQFERSTRTILAGAKMKGIKNVLNKYNTHFIALIIFYENRKIMFYKVFGSLICGIIDKYISVLFVYATRQTIFK